MRAGPAGGSRGSCLIVAQGRLRASSLPHHRGGGGGTHCPSTHAEAQQGGRAALFPSLTLRNTRSPSRHPRLKRGATAPVPRPHHPNPLHLMAGFVHVPTASSHTPLSLLSPSLRQILIHPSP